MLAEYELLGVKPGASRAEITSAYRRAAMRCHPDRNPDDPDAKEKFQQVDRAYRMLLKITPQLRLVRPDADGAATAATARRAAPSPPGRTAAEVQAAVDAWRAARDKAQAQREAFDRAREEEAQARDAAVAARRNFGTPLWTLCALAGALFCWRLLPAPQDIVGTSICLVIAYLLVPRAPKTYFALTVRFVVRHGVPLYFVALFAWFLWKKGALVLLLRSGVIS